MRVFHVRRVAPVAAGATLLVTLLLLSNQPPSNEPAPHWAQDGAQPPPWIKQKREDVYRKIQENKHKSTFNGSVDHHLSPVRTQSTTHKAPPAVPQPAGEHQHLFPGARETHDRVTDQMALQVPETNVKSILVWSGVSSRESSPDFFAKHKCPMQNCILTANRRLLKVADAVLFKDELPMQATIAEKDMRRDQVRILYILESPYHSSMRPGLNDYINWTATYRTDSVINTPYERFTYFKNFTKLPEKAHKNFAFNKTKMAAWFVSNCGAPNGRGNYVAELQKYMEVDIYGGCGKLSCPRTQNDNRCYDYLNKDYRFYLAFENSNCKDYITEKLYWNALKNDVIPIVMGARPEDYARLAPPHSYIHVDDFESPQALAEYLTELAHNDTAYNMYFRWKGTGGFIDTKFWCRLCSLVNVAPDYPMWYRDVSKWWRGPGVCVSPPPGKATWASWRNVTRDDTFMDAVQYGYQRTL